MFDKVTKIHLNYIRKNWLEYNSLNSANFMSFGLFIERKVRFKTLLNLDFI